MPKLQLVYNMRRAPFCPVDNGTLYRTMLDQCEWADRLGFDAIMLGEHHGTADGYVPTPLILAAAVAGRTKNLKLRPMVIVPFFEAAPVRLAEELAVLDLASGGRINPVLIAGYGPSEFEMYGVDLADRPRLMEEMVAFMRQAWTGEPFEYQGRHFQVTPRPQQEPGPTLVLGAATKAGARRAARIGDEFQAAGPGLWHIYAKECEKLGRDTGERWIAGPAYLYVAEDPDRAWQEIGPYVAHQAESFVALARSAGGENVGILPPATDIEALKKLPSYQEVVTPDEAVALAERYDPAGALVFMPQIAGLPPDLSWPSLELFEAAVLPRINLLRPEPQI